MQSALVQMLLMAQQNAEHQQEAVGLAGLYEKLGWPFFVNIFIAIVVLATIAERTYYLLTKFRVDSKELIVQVSKLVQSGNIDRAIKLCEAAEAPILSVFKAGLVQVNRGEDAVVAAIDEKVDEVIPLVEKRVSELFILANIATLFGLLGTILGLIHTFGALGSVSDPGRRQQMLSQGISEAMNNTALGLGIAVTCFVGYLLLNLKSKHIKEDIRLSAMKLTNVLTLGRQS
ncbi:MAG: MotA/TolQ/ExbB proton channel family protein [Myxococcales bacterium]|nr:MotA/TolQ/ExbB proton channel family protein [Myxococcales bacterium]